MSVRQGAAQAAPTAASQIMDIAEQAQSADAALGEGNNFAVANPEHPLKRNVVVSIKASLNDLCLQKQRGTWAPSAEALRAIFQQRKFTSLDGAAEPQGDLKSVVMHSMKIAHVRSSFPVSLGARISGVDDCTYSSTGEAFSAIVLPDSESTRDRELQADDVSLAYEFSRKFPGYTAENLAEKGVHEVNARRFVLVAADHPIVSAIQENADKLQMGEISMMPEGLVKISQQLYESILPLVKTQVESQIKVRDLSRAMVAVQPAEFASWSDARSELMVEAKRPLKAQLAAELSAAADDHDASAIRAKFDASEKELEHHIDHKPLEMHMEIALAYNFLSR